MAAPPSRVVSRARGSARRRDGRRASDGRNPRRLGAWASYTHIHVEDIDAHHARAREAGAVIVRGLSDEEYGDRRYDAEDPEGHRWSFAQRVRDVPPAQWGASIA